MGQIVAARLDWELVDKTGPATRPAGPGRGLEAAGHGARRGQARLERHDWRYHAFLTLFGIGHRDHAAGRRVVIVGRAANYVLAEAPLCLRARVVAPLSLQVERIMAREGMTDPGRAKELVREVDLEQAGYVKVNYGRAWDDAQAYDVTFDTGLKPLLEELAETLARLLADKRPSSWSGPGRPPQGVHRQRARTASAHLKRTPHRAEAIEVSAVIHDHAERQIVEQLARAGGLWPDPRAPVLAAAYLSRTGEDKLPTAELSSVDLDDTGRDKPRPYIKDFIFDVGAGLISTLSISVGVHIK